MSAAQAQRALPRSRRDLGLQGAVCVDSLGPLLLGSFCGPGEVDPSGPSTVSVRSFLLGQVGRLQLRDSVLRFLEAARAVSQGEGAHVLVPPVVAALRDPNALHLVFACPIVSDLSGMVRALVERSAVSTDGLAPDIIWWGHGAREVHST